MPRSAGPWALDKLKIVQQYLPLYLSATGKALDRDYVDAFAGPGTNLIEETGQQVDGSPLIALEAGSREGKAFTRLYFIEADPEAAAELAARLEARGADKRAVIVPGDSNEKLVEVVQSQHRKAPTLVLLDPEGIEPRWKTIEAISEWRTELMINFPLGMAIKRNLDSPKVDQYFGTDEWRTFLKLPPSQFTGAIISFYKGRLRDLGYQHTTDLDRQVRRGDNHSLYYMLFVSKDPAGSRIMNWVNAQPSASGQARLALKFGETRTT